MSVTTHDGARACRRRPRAALAAAALCATTATLLFSAGVAPAAVTTGPVDAGSGFPFSYADDIQGFGLEQCQDESGFCIEAPRPHPDQPISVPDNYTPDEEGFWWLADATVPNAGTGLARFAKESAFDTPGIHQGHQVAFSRVRFRFDGLVAGDVYRITHPYGVDELEAEPDPGAPGSGRINFTDDGGCLAAPCGAFPAPPGERITSFLQWDPTVGAKAPTGYIGNGVTPHAVIGSPVNTNFVRLEHLVAQAPPLPPVAQLVGETSQFVVQGKLAGPPPAPAANVGLSGTSLEFGSREVGSPSASETVVVSNHGTADLNVGPVAVTGTDTADFAKGNDGCSGRALAPGATCSVDVRFAPAHTGDLRATLSVPSNAPRAPHGIALSGSGTGGASSGGGSSTTIVTSAIPVVGRPGPIGAVAGTSARALRVSRLTLARRISGTRARLRGLRLSMQVPSGTQVLRIAVFRQRGGHKQGPALARALRLPSAKGRYVVRLRSRALLRSLRAGRYVVEVTPGRDVRDRGATSTVAFTVTR